VSGESSFTTLSADTIYSGGTNLSDIFLTSGQLSGTSVSPGRNIEIVNVGTDYNVSVVSSPSFNNISFSGTGYGDASNLDGIVTGGTFIKSASTLNLQRNGVGDIIVTGLTDYYTTGITLYDNVLYFDRNDELSAYTVDLSSLVVSASTTDYYTTGATLVGSTAFFDRNDLLSAYTLDLSSLVVSGASDTYVTGGTFIKSASTLNLERNDGGNVVITGLTDNYTTGITLYDNVLYFDRNDQLSAYTVDLSSLVVSASTTDYYTTGATLVGSIAYFDRNDQLSAYTLDLSSLVVSGVSDTYITGGTFIKSASTLTLERNDDVDISITGLTDYYTTGVTLVNNTLYFDRNETDYFTTGATLIGTTVYFDRNDALSAYTLDLSSLLASGNTYITGVTIDNFNTLLKRNDGEDVIISGTTSIYSNTEPDVSLYSGNTWVRTTDYNLLTYDPDRSKWIGSNTNHITGARARNNNNNIFLRYEDGVPYNVNPYNIYSDSTITNIVASDSGLDTWQAVLLTGTTLSTDVIYSLSLSGDGVKYDDSVDVDVLSGTSLYLYMSGTGVSYPRIDVYMKNI
jgi:hypothetical protein